MGNYQVHREVCGLSYAEKGKSRWPAAVLAIAVQAARHRLEF